MTSINGEIQHFIGALGIHPSDEGLEAVLDLPGPTTDTNTESNGGNTIFHLAARGGGTEFMFASEQLVAVFIGTQPRDAWGVYPRPEALMEGLSATATRRESRDLLGEPVWQSEVADRWLLDDGNYLQFQYHDDRIAVVVVTIGD